MIKSERVEEEKTCDAQNGAGLGMNEQVVRREQYLHQADLARQKAADTRDIVLREAFLKMSREWDDLAKATIPDLSDNH